MTIIGDLSDSLVHDFIIAANKNILTSCMVRDVFMPKNESMDQDRNDMSMSSVCEWYIFINI